jgi:hypothetical protein
MEATCDIHLQSSREGISAEEDEKPRRGMSCRKAHELLDYLC